MTIATLERPVAILYTGTTATWCKGGCGKFRYPYCYVGDRPYCEGCAFVSGIRAVTAPVKQKPPKKRPKARIGTKQLIPLALSSGPASGRELAERLNVHQDTITFCAKHLVARNLICCDRRRGVGAREQLWYALPKDIEKLQEKVGKALPELILEELKAGAKTAPALQELLLNRATNRKYYPESIHKALRELVRQGVVVRLDTGFRAYGEITRFAINPERSSAEVTTQSEDAPLIREIEFLKEQLRDREADLEFEYKSRIEAERQLDDLKEQLDICSMELHHEQMLRKAAEAR
jgi:predicted transcriptional regulator